MSTLIMGTFTQFSFTEEEILGASLLHEEQKRWFQTQLATLAEQRVALIPDPNNYSSFIQQEAEIKGQMNALQYLLDCSTRAELELAAKQQ